MFLYDKKLKLQDIRASRSAVDSQLDLSLSMYLTSDIRCIAGYESVCHKDLDTKS